MANLTREQRAEREAAAQAAAEQQQDNGLIAMTKDGQTLRVHPSTVKSHQTAGWKLES
jgi:hypothetical protein